LIYCAKCKFGRDRWGAVAVYANTRIGLVQITFLKKRQSGEAVRVAYRQFLQYRMKGDLEKSTPALLRVIFHGEG